jgi:hypothetical protein
VRTADVVQLLVLLTANLEVPGSIPGTTTFSS